MWGTASALVQCLEFVCVPIVDSASCSLQNLILFSTTGARMNKLQKCATKKINCLTAWIVYTSSVQFGGERTSKVVASVCVLSGSHRVHWTRHSVEPRHSQQTACFVWRHKGRPAYTTQQELSRTQRYLTFLAPSVETWVTFMFQTSIFLFFFCKCFLSKWNGSLFVTETAVSFSSRREIICNYFCWFWWI